MTKAQHLLTRVMTVIIPFLTLFLSLFLLISIQTYSPRVCFCPIRGQGLNYDFFPSFGVTRFITEWLLFAIAILSALTAVFTVIGFNWAVKRSGGINGLEAAVRVTTAVFAVLMVFLSYFYTTWWLLSDQAASGAIPGFISILLLTAVALLIFVMAQVRPKGNFNRRSGSSPAMGVQLPGGYAASLLYLASMTVLAGIFVLLLEWPFINPSVWSERPACCYAGIPYLTGWPIWLSFTTIVLIPSLSLLYMCIIAFMNKAGSAGRM